MIPRNLSVTVARLIYLLICELAGFTLALGAGLPAWQGLAIGLLVAGFFFIVDHLMKGFSLRGFSTATFGLGVGLFCAWLLTRTGLDQLILAAFDSGPETPETGAALAPAVNVAIYASLGFLGTVLALRSNREDFAFVIPYVRFRQDSAAGHPLLADAGVLIDGRLPRLVASGFITGRIIVPRFILDELQLLETSSNPAKKQRGQRGLEVLSSLQENPAIPFSLHEARSVSEEESPETRLIQLARAIPARLVTVDESLTKLAHLQGIEILNLNDLSEALKPSLTVGENLRLALVRAGKDEHQAVGYLPDGTMIVVNHAIAKIGTTRDVRVISMLQTSSGQMVFAELLENAPADS